MRGRTVAVLLVMLVESVGGRVATGPRAVSPGSDVGRIVVQVDGFHGDAGQARAALFTSRDGFPDHEAHAFRTLVTTITDRHVEVWFDSEEARFSLESETQTIGIHIRY